VDPFATLGLTRRFDIDLAELERRYRDLQRAFHPDRHTAAPASERRMTLQKAVEINEAYRVLRDDQRRAEAMLAAVSGEARPEPERVADPELLMEIMELRESLSEAKAAGDAAAVARLSERVARERAETLETLVRTFAALPERPVANALAPARQLVSRLKYYQRFLDEVAVFEDEARS
jgi:molecular chaperone HscB